MAAVVGVAAMVLAAPATVDATPRAVVTVTSTSGTVLLGTNCFGRGREWAYGGPASLTVSRTGDTSAALDVDVEIAGSLQGGVDYPALPDPVVIPAGSTSVTLAVDVSGPLFGSVEGTASLAAVSGAAYDLGTPSNATATVSASAVHLPCIYEDLLAETIRVGETPRVFDLDRWFAGQLPNGYWYRFTGEEPPGLDFVGNGEWGGTAAAPGIYEFHPEWCLDERDRCNSILTVRITVLAAEPGTTTTTTPATAPPAAPNAAEPIDASPAYTG